MWSSKNSLIALRFSVGEMTSVKNELWVSWLGTVGEMAWVRWTVGEMTKNQ